MILIDQNDVERRSSVIQSGNKSCWSLDLQQRYIAYAYRAQYAHELSVQILSTKMHSCPTRQFNLSLAGTFPMHATSRNRLAVHRAHQSESKKGYKRIIFGGDEMARVGPISEPAVKYVQPI